MPALVPVPYIQSHPSRLDAHLAPAAAMQVEALLCQAIPGSGLAISIRLPLSHMPPEACYRCSDTFVVDH